jgi:hypothetical protein
MTKIAPSDIFCSPVGNGQQCHKKTTVMVTRRIDVTLFSFGLQINFFHPDDMFNHVFPFPDQSRSTPIKEIIADTGIIYTL